MTSKEFMASTAPSTAVSAPVPAQVRWFPALRCGEPQRRSRATTYQSVSEIEAELTIRDLMAADRLAPGPLTVQGRDVHRRAALPTAPLSTAAT